MSDNISLSSVVDLQEGEVGYVRYSAFKKIISGWREDVFICLNDSIQKEEDKSHLVKIQRLQGKNGETLYKALSPLYTESIKEEGHDFLIYGDLSAPIIIENENSEEEIDEELDALYDKERNYLQYFIEFLLQKSDPIFVDRFPEYIQSTKENFADLLVHYGREKTREVLEYILYTITKDLSNEELRRGFVRAFTKTNMSDAENYIEKIFKNRYDGIVLQSDRDFDEIIELIIDSNIETKLYLREKENVVGFLDREELLKARRYTVEQEKYTLTARIKSLLLRKSPKQIS